MTSIAQWRSVIAAEPAGRITLLLLAAGVILALLAPFGSGETMAFPARLAHFMISGALIAPPLVLGAGRVVRRHGRAPAAYGRILLLAALAAVPGGLVVAACLRVLAPVALTHVTLPELMAQALLINEVLALIALGVLRGPAPAAAASAASPEQGLAFMARLPPVQRGARLIALAAEDHYLRVHTDRGDALIHMRIADAEALLSPFDGLRVHRSWWVARAAVTGIAREGGQMKLCLDNGLRVPVSRSRAADLRAAGWFPTAPAAPTR